MCRLQQAEGRPDSGAGWDAAAEEACPADVAAAVRDPRFADRQLDALRQRSVLECGVGKVIVRRALRSDSRRLAVYECAPGRAVSLQS